MLIFSGSSADVLTVKTPSFLELKTLVEYFCEELIGSQLQEVLSTENGIVLTLYRFNQNPRVKYLIFDLDKPFPFLGLFDQNPWGNQKKNKPVGLFLNAHAKNLFFQKIELIQKFGRVVQFELGQDQAQTQIQFRLIPKQTNLIVQTKDNRNKVKTISWYPVVELKEISPEGAFFDDEDQRSIPFLMKQWFERRSLFSQTKIAKNQSGSSLSPYEKWRRQKEKDIEKKTKALVAIQKQIELFQTEPWALVGEHLKIQGFKNLKPEWSVYIKYDQSVSENMQNCFLKAKNAKLKSVGAYERKGLVQSDIKNLQDLSEAQFEKEMKRLALQKNKVPARVLEGRFRKLSVNEQSVTCYMGKSAQDNLDLLRKAKAWDYWLHLKDYPSAHAIIHRQKDQVVSDQDLLKCARWLVKEGLNEKQSRMGGRFGVVVAECRYVRPIKGDKLGRVTYNEAREFLIAL